MFPKIQMMTALSDITKTLSKKLSRPALVIILPAVLSFIISAAIFSHRFSFNHLSLPSPINRLAVNSSLVDISNPANYQGLPVGEVKTYSASQAWGTVIYLPQFHKSPVNEATDKVNDISVNAQSETYQILDFLSKSAGVNLVMVEGNLYGEVPAEKIAPLANKIEKKKELASLEGDLIKAFEDHDINPPLEKQLLEQLSRETNKLDREITLEGAPRVMKAEGKDIKLYGAEDKPTYDQSIKIYEDYRYLSDRINQLNNPLAGKSSLVNSQSFFLNGGSFSPLKDSGALNDVLKLLVNRRSAPPFAALEAAALAKGKNDLADLIKKTEAVYNELENNIPRGVMVNNSKETLLGSSNPYTKVTNKGELQKKLAVRKTDVEEVIVKKRNSTTAENMANALRAEKKSVGILQFGAGHEEGLVKDINNQGLTVVVVKPKEIVAMSSQLSGI